MMLTTMLKGLRTTAPTSRSRPDASSRPRVAVVDISGPLPESPKPAERTALPYVENDHLAARRPMGQTTLKTPMSDLPAEVDPFEADFPWIGWVEPKHQSIVRSDIRSSTFQQDMERVLAIFAN